MCTTFCQLLLCNQAAVNGHGGSPSRLCRRIAGLVEGGLLSCSHRSKVGQCPLIGDCLRVLSRDLAGADLGSY